MFPRNQGHKPATALILTVIQHNLFLRKLLQISIIILCLSCSDNSEKNIGIQPLGQFDKSLIDTLQTTIKKVYNFKVSILKSKEIPKSTFINIKTPRYRADKILKILKAEKPDSINHVLGLISKDISTTKKDKWGNTKKPEKKYEDWGIFGLGYRPGASCVVSSYRYKNNKLKFIDRFKKICVHEIGHNLGLKHCPNEDCVMRDAAESIKTIDLVKLSLCNECRLKID